MMHSMATLEKARRNGKQYLNPVPTSVGSWSTFLKVLWRYLTDRAERTPKQAWDRSGPMSGCTKSRRRAVCA